MAPISNILTPEEAAAYLRIHLRTLDQFIEARQIPYRNVGDPYRFRRTELDAWLSQQEGCSVDAAVAEPVPQQALSRRLLIKIEPVPSGRSVPAYRKKGDRWVPTAALKALRAQESVRQGAE